MEVDEAVSSTQQIVLSLSIGFLANVTAWSAYYLYRRHWFQVRERIARRAKYVSVTWRQMRPAERQQTVMGAGMVVFFVWWAAAIVMGK